MNKKIEKAINKQIQAEFYSAYMYLAMAAYCEAEDYLGAANWMKIQAQEEVTHAMKFYDFVNQVGGKVELFSIEAPPKAYGSLLNMFEEGLKHEKLVTKLIHDLYELAHKEKDYAFESFLKWYVDEQVEEEANATEIIAKIKSVGSSKEGLFLIDQELAKRTFVDETL